MIRISELNHCYRLLELEPGASLGEINQAYKDLAFIWHPDRIPADNDRLRQKAIAKLQALNYAREQLRLYKPVPQSTKHSFSRQAPTSHTTASNTTASNTTVRRTQAAYAPPYEQSRSAPVPDPSPEPIQTDRASSTSRPAATYRYHRPPSGYDQAPPSPHQSFHRPMPDLSGSDMSGANLMEKDFSGRNLSNANLSQADLTDAFLHGVNLSGANLSGAKLYRANLLHANLSHANLREANLVGADLSGADLTNANLQGARVGMKDRVMVKLTGAKLTGAIMPDGRVYQ